MFEDNEARPVSSRSSRAIHYRKYLPWVFYLMGFLSVVATIVSHSLIPAPIIFGSITFWSLAGSLLGFGFIITLTSTLLLTSQRAREDENIDNRTRLLFALSIFIFPIAFALLFIPGFNISAGGILSLFTAASFIVFTSLFVFYKNKHIFSQKKSQTSIVLVGLNLLILPAAFALFFVAPVFNVSPLIIYGTFATICFIPSLITFVVYERLPPKPFFLLALSAVFLLAPPAVFFFVGPTMLATLPPAFIPSIFATTYFILFLTFGVFFYYTTKVEIDEKNGFPSDGAATVSRTPSSEGGIFPDTPPLDRYSIAQTPEADTKEPEWKIKIKDTIETCRRCFHRSSDIILLPPGEEGFKTDYSELKQRQRDLYLPSTSINQQRMYAEKREAYLNKYDRYLNFFLVRADALTDANVDEIQILTQEVEQTLKKLLSSHQKILGIDAETSCEALLKKYEEFKNALSAICDNPTAPLWQSPDLAAEAILLSSNHSVSINLLKQEIEEMEKVLDLAKTLWENQNFRGPLFQGYEELRGLIERNQTPELELKSHPPEELDAERLIADLTKHQIKLNHALQELQIQEKRLLRQQKCQRMEVEMRTARGEKLKRIHQSHLHPATEEQKNTTSSETKTVLQSSWGNLKDILTRWGFTSEEEVFEPKVSAAHSRTNLDPEMTQFISGLANALFLEGEDRESFESVIKASILNAKYNFFEKLYTDKEFIVHKILILLRVEGREPTKVGNKYSENTKIHLKGAIQQYLDDWMACSEKQDAEKNMQWQIVGILYQTFLPQIGSNNKGIQSSLIKAAISNLIRTKGIFEFQLLSQEEKKERLTLIHQDISEMCEGFTQFNALTPQITDRLNKAIMELLQAENVLHHCYPPLVNELYELFFTGSEHNVLLPKMFLGQYGLTEKDPASESWSPIRADLKSFIISSIQTAGLSKLSRGDDEAINIFYTRFCERLLTFDRLRMNETQNTEEKERVAQQAKEAIAKVLEKIKFLSCASGTIYEVKHDDQLPFTGISASSSSSTSSSATSSHLGSRLCMTPKTAVEKAFAAERREKPSGEIKDEDKAEGLLHALFIPTDHSQWSSLKLQIQQILQAADPEVGQSTKAEQICKIILGSPLRYSKTITDRNNLIETHAMQTIQAYLQPPEAKDQDEMKKRIVISAFCDLLWNAAENSCLGWAFGSFVRKHFRAQYDDGTPWSVLEPANFKREYPNFLFLMKAAFWEHSKKQVDFNDPQALTDNLYALLTLEPNLSNRVKSEEIRGIAEEILSETQRITTPQAPGRGSQFVASNTSTTPLIHIPQHSPPLSP